MTDARHCPSCCTQGILPLDRLSDERDRIANPVMHCPNCQTEFRATGVTWLGAFRPSTEVGPEGLTDEQIAEMAEAMADVLWEEHERATTQTRNTTSLEPSSRSSKRTG